MRGITDKCGNALRVEQNLFCALRNYRSYDGNWRVVYHVFLQRIDLYQQRRHDHDYLLAHPSGFVPVAKA